MGAIRTGCPHAKEWSAFYFGVLPEETIRYLAAHLEVCPECAATLHALEGQVDGLVQRLRRLPKEESSGEVTH